MSWSISFIGKPENVALAIEAESATMSGDSKLEYDDAMPHLAALVRQNFAKEGSLGSAGTVKIIASGHGSTNGNEQISRQINVVIDHNYIQMV